MSSEMLIAQLSEKGEVDIRKGTSIFQLHDWDTQYNVHQSWLVLKGYWSHWASNCSVTGTQSPRMVISFTSSVSSSETIAIHSMIWEEKKRCSCHLSKNILTINLEVSMEKNTFSFKKKNLPHQYGVIVAMEDLHPFQTPSLFKFKHSLVHFLMLSWVFATKT